MICGSVGFYDISAILDYLMPNPFYTYISNIYDLVWFGLILWHISHCRLFNIEFSTCIFLNTYNLVWFDLVWLAIVDYFMPYYLITNILNPYDLVRFVYIKYMVSKHTLQIPSLKKLEFIFFFCTQLSVSLYFYFISNN